VLAKPLPQSSQRGDSWISLTGRVLADWATTLRAVLLLGIAFAGLTVLAARVAAVITSAVTSVGRS
jgi:hypothetical protein